MKIALVMCNKQKQGYPPLGVLYLASYVRHYAPECQVDVFDVFPPVDTLLMGAYDVVGFSCMSIQYPDACDYAEELRKGFSKTVVIGGVHTTLTHGLPVWADYGIVGEGERTLLELVQWLSGPRGGTPDLIPGLVMRKGGALFETPPREQIKDLDTIPFPAWDLIDMAPYLRDNNVYGTVVGRGLSLLTTRGCCYRCEFCAAQRMWGNVRFHSARYVADMIQFVVEHYGVEHIWMADDHFALNKRRLAELADLLSQRRISVGLGINCRVESYDAEMRDLLRRLNVRAIALGLETGSDRVLKRIKSGSRLTVAQEQAVVEQMSRDGFQIHGMFMVNIPEETVDDLQMTVDFIHRLPLSKLSVAVATPYYGTKWWEIAREQNIVPEDENACGFLRTYNMKDLSAARPVFVTGIPRDLLERTYSSLAQYARSLFYFDWENR